MPASTVRTSLTFVVLAVLAVCLTLEALFPHLRPKRRTLKNSYRTNAWTFLFNNITLPLFSVSSLYYVAQSYSHVGLLSRVDDNLFKWCISLVLLDLAFYWWHYANHKLSFLWMFHKVHHSDRTVTVSTGIRFHIGELLLTVLLKSAFIVVIGVSAQVVFINETILTLFVLFHHSNIAFRGETWLSRILIVPKLHRLHHSARRDEHVISEITPLIIITKLEQYDYAGATAVAAVMLVTSFVLLLIINGLQEWTSSRSGKLA